MFPPFLVHLLYFNRTEYQENNFKAYTSVSREKDPLYILESVQIPSTPDKNCTFRKFDMREWVIYVLKKGEVPEVAMSVIIYTYLLLQALSD